MMREALAVRVPEWKQEEEIRKRMEEESEGEEGKREARGKEESVDGPLPAESAPSAKTPSWRHGTQQLPELWGGCPFSFTIYLFYQNIAWPLLSAKEALVWF